MVLLPVLEKLAEPVLDTEKVPEKLGEEVPEKLLVDVDERERLRLALALVDLEMESVLERVGELDVEIVPLSDVLGETVKVELVVGLKL